MNSCHGAGRPPNAPERQPHHTTGLVAALTEERHHPPLGVAPQDQRYASVYIFGAVCPKEGKGAALVLPLCNTVTMSLHLAEISEMVSPGRHAVLLLDQAGWHLSGEVVVPDNITLLPLPPKCPELNVMENVWQFMRDNWLTGAAPGPVQERGDAAVAGPSVMARISARTASSSARR